MRYWVSRECLAAHFVGFWGAFDVLTTLVIVHVSSIELEINPAMAALIGVHPMAFITVKLAAGLAVAHLLHVHAGESRLAHGLLAACAVFSVLLVAGNLATIIWLVA